MVFLFSGQGAQYVGMGRELYELEASFRATVDRSAQALEPHIGCDLREVLYPSPGEEEEAGRRLEATAITQPALFVVEYALAKLWMEWGIEPQAMIGHSIGEYVAATLADVFSLDDALRLVAVRGRLMQEMPAGSMLSIPLAEEEVEPLVGGELSLAAVNAPAQSTVSGPTPAIEELARRLAERDLDCRHLHTSHAFHSAMMEPILERFTDEVRRVKLYPPRIPYLSNLTGSWVRDEEATDPGYWARHLRETVRFSAGISELVREPERLLLEVGPGRTLATLARRYSQDRVALTSLRHPRDAESSDLAFLLTALGRLWLAGRRIEWPRIFAGQSRRRLALPTYPFELHSYWIEPGAPAAEPAPAAGRAAEMADWFYLPSWRLSLPPPPCRAGDLADRRDRWLVFVDEAGLGAELVARLRGEGQEVFAVTAGEEYARHGEHAFAIDPRRSGDYGRMLAELGGAVETIVHLWSVSRCREAQEPAERFAGAQDRGYYSLLYLAQALGRQEIGENLLLLVAANDLHSVTGQEASCPEKATLLGPCMVLPQESPGIVCRVVDLVVPASDLTRPLEQLLAEIRAPASHPVVAYRGPQRWVEDFEKISLTDAGEPRRRLRERGVVLITGALGEVGLQLAEILAREVGARLVLVDRTALPERSQWEALVETAGDGDEIHRTLRRLLALEEAGAELLVVTADVADEGAMRSAFECAEERFGPLHGVIHAAGALADDVLFRPLTELDRAGSEERFRVTAHGSYVLEKVVAGRELEFVLLFSSTAAVLGGLGLAGCAASDRFMDALVAVRRAGPAAGGPAWISSAWDRWPGTHEEAAAAIRASTDEFAMTPEERREAFLRLLRQAPEGGIVVSTGDLSARRKLWIEQLPERSERRGALHDRPDLATDYVAPRSEIEKQIAAVWQDLLGVRRVGIHDSFFELGGDSFLAVQVISRLRKALNRDLPVVSLYEGLTIRALAAALEGEEEQAAEHPELNLADVAYTLKLGRRAFRHRRAVVAQSCEDAVEALEPLDPRRVFTAVPASAERPVVFLFSGQGVQHVNMGRELYQGEARFREEVDRCSEILEPHLGLDLRTLLYPVEDKAAEAAQRLEQTAVAQPALFVVEYALAALWREWGVRPEAMIGHSIGEYVAACLAGVFSLEDALALVAARGRLMQEMPAGTMLSVALAEEELRPLLGEGLSLAAVNGPGRCVVSGPADALEAVARQLAAEGVQHRSLHTSHAFHSAMMDPILEPFLAEVRKVRRNAPQIPFISNVTGSRIADEAACDPQYWVGHLRKTVRFSEGLGELFREPERVLLEVGPGNALHTFAREHPERSEHAVLNSLPHPNDRRSELAFLLTAVGRLWLAGVEIDDAGIWAHERRHRLPLPSYPFERRRYWIDQGEGAAPPGAEKRRKQPDVGDWFYFPSWRRSAKPEAASEEAARDRRGWLILADELGVGARLVEHLLRTGRTAVTVTPGERFERLGDGVYTIDARLPGDYDALLRELHSLNRDPGTIVHLWTLTAEAPAEDGAASFDRMQERSFYPLIFLARALGNHGASEKIRIEVISDHLHEVIGGEALCPEKATVLGPCKVIPQEFPNLTCRSIDIEVPAAAAPPAEELAERLLAEIASPPEEAEVAYRGSHRWVRTFEKRKLGGGAEPPARLRRGGVYLITGGLGGVGLVLAEYLARSVGARLVLVGRSPLPDPHEWERWLESHDQAEATSRKIRKIRELEASGAEVLAASADVADREQMREVLTRAHERFGALHGVIHAAGIAGGGLIQLKTPEEVARVFRPKTLGILTLEALLRDSALDFLVLFSSISSVLGEFGQVDYCAANLFLDAWAHHRCAAGGTFTVAVNWDTWQEVGIAVSTEVPEEMRQLREEAIRLGISNLEGQDAFARILAESAGAQVVVCTRDLEAAIEQVREFTHARILAATGQAAGPKHPRPQLEYAYAVPESETEQTVAELWQEVLGIEQVGRHDNFFDLGGHSLLATQLMSRLRQALRLELPVERLFEAPTVAGLAEHIETVRWAARGQEGLADTAAAERDEGEL